MSKKPNFTLYDFKKWMGEDRTEPIRRTRNKDHSLVGTEVESKIDEVDRLITKIETDDGEIEELSETFIAQGGTIAQVDGGYFLIEVECGSFYIPKFLVRRA